MKLKTAPCLLLLALFCAVSQASEGAYSTVTVKGEKCAPDHPCGQHDENYYWCYKDHYGARGSDWDYCCKPDHPCDDHSAGYNWCYNGFSWSYCNKPQVAPRQMTVSGKSCSPDHSCAQHGKSYNWCYTPGSWDFCCKEDHPCGKHGETYDWCYVGRFSVWKECQTASSGTEQQDQSQSAVNTTR